MAMKSKIEEMRESIKRVIYRRESSRLAQRTLSTMCLTEQQKQCTAIACNEKVLTAIMRVNDINKKLEEIEKQLQSEIANIKRPEFSSPELCHPLNFLEDLMDYLEDIPSEYRTPETVIDCLQGDAYSWAMIFKQRWTNIEDFKKDFLEQYWGRAEQNMLRREIICGVWDSNETMTEHFTSLVAQAKLLTRPMPEQQLVYDIMSHFSDHVLLKWKSMNRGVPIEKHNYIVAATNFLKTMDAELPAKLKITRAQRVASNTGNTAIILNDSDDDDDYIVEPEMSYNENINTVQMNNKNAGRCLK